MQNRRAIFFSYCWRISARAASRNPTTVQCQTAPNPLDSTGHHLQKGFDNFQKPSTIRSSRGNRYMRSETNTNLSVEYKEKDKVKILGARWKPEEKVWYVPAGLDLEPFAPWLPGNPDLKASAKPSNPSPLSPAGKETLPYARKRGKLYHPADPEPFAVSRTKIDLFRECPRCFYLDRRLGIRRPSGPPFLLNSAVDLKKRFVKSL